MSVQKSCAIIGSGPGGLAAAIRMANKGYKVTVYEKNNYPGGKLSEFHQDGFRFDFGPSVFTRPEYIDELYTLSGKNPRDYYEYIHLNPGYRYFYEDGTVLNAYHPRERFAEEASKITGESKERILKYLKNSEDKYELTKDVFLYNSMHRFKNLLNTKALKGILNLGKVDVFRTMNEANKATFKDPRLVQLFNRYATYNGSSPFLAPATLNVIPHLEINLGIFYPKGGMFSITKGLEKLGKDIGIDFQYNTPVEEIIIENNKAVGVRTPKGIHKHDVVVSNMDIYYCYHKLMPSVKKPEKVLKQEKSSSAIVFYWGIKHNFTQLGLHNIFWGKEYEKEFSTVVNEKNIYHDPTVYVNITSKHTPSDAPEGCENWFAMVNAPHDSGQDWDEFVKRTRENVIQKLSRVLGKDIRPLIATEALFTPPILENKTWSAFGAIYGNASNNKFAAFLRHSNFHSSIKNLYFCGGSVHPGPSIPLCMLSAKIATDEVK